MPSRVNFDKQYQKKQGQRRTDKKAHKISEHALWNDPATKIK